MLDACTGLVPNLQRPYTMASESFHDQVRAVSPALGDAAANSSPADFWRSGPASVQALCRTIRHGMNTCPTQLPVRLRAPESATPLSPASPPCPSAPRPEIGDEQQHKIASNMHVSYFCFILKPRFRRWLREQQHVHAIVTPSPFMLHPITKQPALLGNLHRVILIP